MARDQRSIPPDGIWASSGDVEDPVTSGITIAEGWDERYSEQGGLNPKRETFNSVYQLIFAALNELNKGFFEWDASIDYPDKAYTVASDGRIYQAIQSSTNQNPTAPQSAFWKPLINSSDGTNQSPSPPTATQSRAGIVELASNAETQAGTDDLRAVTPASLESKIATAIAFGLTQYATNAETQSGTINNKAVTPAGLESKTATTGRLGIAQLATNSEVESGTDGTKIVTSSSLQNKLDGIIWSGSQAQYDALTVKNPSTFYYIHE